MKKSYFLVVLVSLIVTAWTGRVNAQSMCVVSDTIKNQNGQPQSGVKVTVSNVRLNGQLISMSPKSYTTSSSGIVSFSLPQGAQVNIESYIWDFNVPGGKQCLIPVAASVLLRQLQSGSLTPETNAGFVNLREVDRSPGYSIAGNNDTLEVSNGTLTNPSANVYRLTIATANSFETIDVAVGTDPVADSATDILKLASPDLTITGSASRDSINFAYGAGSIFNADVNANAAIDESKLALNYATHPNANDALYIVRQPDGDLDNAQALSLLGTGLMKVNTTSGFVTSLTTMAGIDTVISDLDIAGAGTGNIIARRASGVWVDTTLAALGLAPPDADYLVGTANGGLSAEIVVGTTPGGELGGTWGSPTIDAEVYSADELSDVTITTAAATHILVRNAGNTAFENVAVSGDASLAATGALTVTDDSHAHTTMTISGLNLANDLDAFSSADLSGRLSDEVGSGFSVFSIAPALTGAVTFGNGATSAGTFRILEDTDDGSEYTQFSVPALAANVLYTLPPDDGDAGEQLQTNGSGTLTWEAAGSGGISVQTARDSTGWKKIGSLTDLINRTSATAKNFVVDMAGAQPIFRTYASDGDNGEWTVTTNDEWKSTNYGNGYYFDLDASNEVLRLNSAGLRLNGSGSPTVGDAEHTLHVKDNVATGVAGIKIEQQHSTSNAWIVFNTPNSTHSLGSANSLTNDPFVISSGDGLGGTDDLLTIDRSTTACYLGDDNNEVINNFVIGQGNSTSNAITSQVIRGTNASGTNQIAPSFQFITSLATGNAASGDFVFKTSSDTTSGTVVQRASIQMIIEGNDGGVTLGDAATNTALLTMRASDADAYTVSINTSDQALFAGATGGYSFANGDVQLGTTIDESAVSAGSNAFSGTAVTDTVTITGAANTDLYMVQLTGAAAPAATDPVRVEATTTGFVVHRGVAGTSGLTYAWFRRKP